MKTQIIFTLAVIAITMFACTQAFRTKMKAQNFLETQTTQSQCQDGTTVANCIAANQCSSCNTTKYSNTEIATLCVEFTYISSTLYEICDNSSPRMCHMQPEDQNPCTITCGGSAKNVCDEWLEISSCCTQYWAYS